MSAVTATNRTDIAPKRVLELSSPSENGGDVALLWQRSDNAAAVEAESSHALFVLPRGQGDGFQASISGHILDLADPNSGHGLAPTPDDLFIASISSDFAWSARTLLRAHGLPDDVSVSAEWHGDRLNVADIRVTITVSERAEAMSEALAATLENRVAARSLPETTVHISLKGVNR